eukprot:7367184-Prymnesium_polylepis.1
MRQAAAARAADDAATAADAGSAAARRRGSRPLESRSADELLNHTVASAPFDPNMARGRPNMAGGQLAV